MIGVLVDLTVKATLLCLAAGVLTMAMRRASAASRHLVWTGLFLAVLALPVARVLLPALPVFVLAAPTQPPIAQQPVEVKASAPVRMPMATVAATGASSLTTLVPDTPVQESISRPPITTGDVVKILWLSGVVILLARIGIGRMRVRRIGRRAAALNDARAVDRMEQLRRLFHVRRPIALRSSADEWMPMTWGVVRPVILLPVSALQRGESQEVLDAMLGHEVAHVARFDAASDAVSRVVVAAGWFHPFLWLAARQARLECERACDDAVLACGSRPSEYASQLLAFVDTTGPASAGASHTLAMARRSHLEQRVRSILNVRTNRRRASRLSRWMAAALVIAAVPGAAVQLAARTPAPDPVVIVPGPAPAQVDTTTATAPIPPRPSTVIPSVQIAAQGGTPQVAQTTASCTTADPFATFGGGRCVNGGWLPPSSQKTLEQDLADAAERLRQARLARAQNAPAAAAAYLIGADDVLIVTVWRAPEVSGDVRVKPDGTIRLSMGNDIRAAGQTTDQLKGNIRDELARFYTQPDVFVQVKQINSRMIFVPAAANPPATVQTMGEAAQRHDEQLTMLGQLINIAEYLRRDVLTRIEIGTSAPADTVGPERTQLELERLMTALRTAPAPSAAEMTSIRSRWIAALRNIERETVRFHNGLSTWGMMHEALMSAAAAVGAPVTVAGAGVVWITGEVNQPGKYPVAGAMTITQLITLAGGFLATADRDQVVVVSATLKDKDGQPVLRTVNYSDIEKGKNLAQNVVQLSPGDVVIVRPVR